MSIFLNIFNKNKNALSLKKNICKFILLKIDSVDLEGKALLKNCLFFLEVELDDAVGFIKKSTKKINHKNFSNVIFFKSFIFINTFNQLFRNSR